MWSRQVLKEKAKERVKGNYWKMVLVGLILFVALGSAGSSGISASNWNTEDEDAQVSFNFYDDYGNDYGFSYPRESTVLSPLVVAGLVIAAIVGVAIAIVLAVFVLNPLAVGCRNFFYRNIHENAQVKEVAFGFDSNYKNIVKISFFRALYTILWSLLLVIPGIVKAYEYRMISYLLAESPDMSQEEAFAISKRMMYGNKWKAFVFDLSFIGWEILGVLTCGILTVFYVNPYYNQAAAMLYDAIKIDDRMRYQNGNNTAQEDNFQNNAF